MLAWENSGFSVDASVRITLLDRDVLRANRLPSAKTLGLASHESLISRKTVAEVPLAGQTFIVLRRDVMLKRR